MMADGLSASRWMRCSATTVSSGPSVQRAVYNVAHLTYEQAGDDIVTKTTISDFHDDAHDRSQAFFEKCDPCSTRGS